MPQCGRELNRGHADAGCAALHQQRFIPCQAGTIKYIAPYGKKRFGQRCRFQRTETFRRRQTLPHWRRTIFRVTASLHQRAYHVTRLKIAASHVPRDDFTGDFESRQFGGPGWNRIFPHALQHIRAVDAGCMHLD